jgi:hypothetical protein
VANGSQADMSLNQSAHEPAPDPDDGFLAKYEFVNAPPLGQYVGAACGMAFFK